MILVDAGNAVQDNSWWRVIEYKYLVTGFLKMGYKVLNFGQNEQIIPEEEFKKIIKENKDLPYISANVTFKDKTRFAEPYKIIDFNGVKVGFLGVTDLFNVQNNQYLVTDVNEAIEKYLPELITKSDIQILIASIDEVAARSIVKKFPDFELVFFGGATKDFNVWRKTSLYGPFGLGEDEKAPYLLREGEIGRFQLLMKLKYEKGNLIQVDAQDIELSDEVKDDPEMHKYVHETMEKELIKENRNRIGSYGPPGDNDYTAAIDCADSLCHKEQFKAWEKSKHANAYITLSTTKRKGVSDPGKNPRCVSCHTLGFADPDGGYLSSYDIPESRKGVSCGNCHGKARTHMERAYELSEEGKLIDMDVFPEIRKPDVKTCIKCHDAENDKHFFDQGELTEGNFKHKLKEISKEETYKHFNFEKSWARYLKSNWSKKYGKFDKKE